MYTIYFYIFLLIEVKLVPFFGNCIKLRCDSRFQRAFTACTCVFKVITLIGSNQGDYFENATACSKRTLKKTVATRLYYKWRKTTWRCIARNNFIYLQFFFTFTALLFGVSHKKKLLFMSCYFSYLAKKVRKIF